MAAQSAQPRFGWRKSSYSTNGGNCVEVAVLAGNELATPGTAGAVIAVRDSKNPDGPRLYFTSAEWRAFVHRISSTR